ncbi:telomere-associated protein RIF1 isoform X2 [Channa argus]|uniref:telomere-associated protein RIF1 isoform X2 n=1 Tax=Channa argus TaxID=215402 RepID=UPI0035220BFA
MMATAEPPSSSSLLPLLESLEDGASEKSEQTDAYLTIANRLSGEEGRQFLPVVEMHFSRLGKSILAHINSPDAELSQAALQALGFCVYHSHVVSGVPETFAAETLTALCSLVVKSTDKNTCTRALWVISKQSFSPDVVGQKVSSILETLESVWSREDIQSVVMEHEALNVVIRMLEQVPAQMGEGAVRWAKLVIPLVVHSAPKVRLRAAAAMEMGMPLVLDKQTEVAAVIEPLMSTKLVPELQKLFMSKNETNVLKLWPLFVKLLGKLLHRGGPFINSLLHLEELGFRSSSPSIKKIAFIAWKSLIDNFALNPDILCSAKRMKLLMQPLTSIHVRTEALMLTKVEVWWYLVVQLGSNLSSNFDQVAVPLLQRTIGSESSSVPGTPSRTVAQNGAPTPGTPKTGTPGFSSPANTSRMSLNSSVQAPAIFPSIQLLGLEMLLHCFAGPEAVAVAAKNKLILSLEPLKHPLLSGVSSFTKHAAVLLCSIKDGFTNIGKDAPDSLLAVIWTSLARFVNLTIESVGSKKDRQGCEVLTLMLQALQSIITTEDLPAAKVLILFEATVKCIPQRVLGSASYQVGKMDVLNGTPALFLILLLYNSSMLPAYIEDERFFHCLQTLVGCGLSGPTSPLAFAEAVLGAIRRSAGSVQNKEQLWRMWSVMVGSLTDTITQSNEVNQGDALEHNFSALHSALLFPVTHLLHGAPLQQVAQKSMLSAWSKLYKVFARCSALVVTAEENICCEELCAKMTASIDRDALKVPSTLNAVANILQVMVECVDFSPFTPQFQQKLKSPHTPVNWMRKRNKALGNLSTFQSLLVQCLEVYLEGTEASAEATGVALVSILSALFTNLVLANAIQEALTSLIGPLTLFYKQAGSEPPKFNTQLQAKLEKLLSDVLGCLQSRSALAYDDELLALLSPLLCVLFPHKSKQLRTPVIHFWNATFANSVSLTYPEEIRPVLSQLKQKTPIILPGFEAVTVSDELSGPYSCESSQLETKLSGMPFSSVGKRESLLGKTAELKDKSSPKISKPVSTKLDFSSPKPRRREVLEEEASVDFVFIPPETKERVLTEHQKEVKRSKRVDIPAMYNNLDASLDTTVFTQYTQSQDDSLDKLPTEQADKVTAEAPSKVLQEGMEVEEDLEILSKETQDYASPKAAENMTDDHHQEEVISESRNVSMEDDAKSDDKPEHEDMLTEEGKSPSIPGSSDSMSETPRKPKSRRQSFITLEKYVEGKPASPSTASTFTGALIKTSKRSHTSKALPSQGSQSSTSPNSQDSQAEETNPPCPVNDAHESPRRPKDPGMKSEPVRLIERLQSDTTEDEDIIPDTQTAVEGKESTKISSTSEETKPSSQEGESDETLDNSQTPTTQTSPGEPRRSGRHRMRPLLPGEDPKEREDKYVHVGRRRSGAETKSDSPKSNSTQSRPNTRSAQATEEDSGRERLRTRGQKEESSQTNSQVKAKKRIKLFRNSQDFLDKPQPKRRRARENESSQNDLLSDSQSDYESQGSRHSRAPVEIMEEGRPKKKVLPEKEESSQSSTRELAEQTAKDNGLNKDIQMTAPSSQSSGESQEIKLVEQTEKDGDKPNKDSQTVMTSPQTDGKSQEHELVQQPEKDVNPKMDSQIVTTSSQIDDKSQEFELSGSTNREMEDSQLVVSSPANEESKGTTSKANKLVNEEQVKHRRKTKAAADNNVNQEDTPSSSDSQSLRRSRRSKASSETPESEKNSVARQSRPNSQTPASAVGQTEAKIGGRTRRSKVQEEVSKSSPGLTPESSQSLDGAGSTESSRGRYSRRRSSQTPNIDTSESESSEGRECSPKPQNRGRKTRASLQSPLTLESKEVKVENSMTNDDSVSQNTDTQDFEANNVLNDSPRSQDVEGSGSLQVTGDTEEPEKENSVMEVEVNAVEAFEPVAPEKTETDNTKMSECETNADTTPAQERGDTGDLSGICSDSGISKSPRASPVSSAVDTLAPPNETPEKLQVSQSSDKNAEIGEKQDCLEHTVVAEENSAPDGSSSSQCESPNVTDNLLKDNELSASNQPTEASAEDDMVPLQENNKDGKTQTLEPQDEEKSKTDNTENDLVKNVDAALVDVRDASISAESTNTNVCHDSPAKQKDLEAVMGLDVGQSPISGRTRGTWSPSASPSTSILKKGQKRPLEEESPSPLVKLRRVSFADPIQRQEVADDIDRRSPAVRTSSPRRSKVGSLPQPKYVTTPTKGPMISSPRTLHSPGYKSSKKCLISELSQEPRPVSRDCIYPALVGCSAPVEAVLPQISSTMWSRGFGQLVRARNIKTVGDLSALTPSEIKTLPVRSPKISNVKKALKIYEQQRKGRGGDELKSFDETEMMTSEPEETSAPQNQDDEEKTSGEALATELVDEQVSAEGKLEQDASGNETLDVPVAEHQQPARGRLHPDGLLSEVEALTCRMTPLELVRCSPQQLVQVHDQLGGLMRRVVMELQARLCQTDARP